MKMSFKRKLLSLCKQTKNNSIRSQGESFLTLVQVVTHTGQSKKNHGIQRKKQQYTIPNSIRSHFKKYRRSPPTQKFTSNLPWQYNKVQYTIAKLWTYYMRGSRVKVFKLSKTSSNRSDWSNFFKIRFSRQNRCFGSTDDRALRRKVSEWNIWILMISVGKSEHLR